MFRLKKISREKTIKDEINALTSKLCDDYTDLEICEILTSVQERSLAYLKFRKEHLTNELNTCIECIKKIEG